MRAALITELGRPPEVADRPVPEPAAGEVLVEMAAVAINPVDVNVGSGKFYGGHPPLPYVPGVEGVGRIASGPRAGTLVYAYRGGLGMSRNGTAAGFFTAPESALVDVPAGADPALACAMGVAGLAGWLPLTWRAPVRAGDVVLVLGATGATGQVAVAAARHRGAGRIVAVGRNPQRLAALEGQVDAVVSLADPDLAARLAEACAPGADVIYDPLWGEPLVAALGAARAGARIVHLGASAGPTAALPSAAVRGKQLDILGYSNFALPADVLAAGYRELVELAAAGQVTMDFTRVPLAEAARAWEGQRAGSGKFVLVP